MLRFLFAAMMVMNLSLPAGAKKERKPKKRKRTSAQVAPFNTKTTLKLAIEDLVQTYGARYSNGKDYLNRLQRIGESDKAALSALRREAMLANPLLDFDRIILIRRKVKSARGFADKSVSRFGNGINLGLPWRNPHSTVTIANPVSGWENEICVMSNLRGKPKFERVYKSPGGEIICELELGFDAKKVMFSSISSKKRWHVFETNLGGGKPKQLTPEIPAVDFFDACYLPDGNIVLSSTAHMSGLPCEHGTTPVGMPFLLTPATKKLRQLGFDQESSWDYSVMDDGRVFYQRYEYTDTPHYFTRLPFTMNPDGTNQRAFYGSNSYWPNSIFGLRQVPGHPSMFVGTVTGHHGLSRMGRLILFDNNRGTHEADGVVQSLPGRGQKVEPIITDQLYHGYYPKALYPYPLADPKDARNTGGKYFLSMMKLNRDGLWGVYLVDVFDNITLIHEEEDHFFADPTPLRPRPRPPVIPPRVNLSKNTATVYLQDVYAGPGLKGIPRGTVKQLRVISYHFSVTHTGSHDYVGIESGWDVKRILGTVDVEKDGSAIFTVPAGLPIAIQPLDKDGAALQLMRSWMTAQPGEVLSCVGCHEDSKDTPSPKRTLASSKAPQQIKPWRGPARPFGFEAEVQPLLDKRCVSCHNGKERKRPDLRRVTVKYDKPKRFSPAYIQLQKYVRRPGPESDYHLLSAMEFHASTSELIQMLKAGHNDVELTPEEWTVFYTWIDLNAPYHGSILEQNGGVIASNWQRNKKPFIKMDSQQEVLGCNANGGSAELYRHRLELSARFGQLVVDPEQEFIEHLKQVLAKTVTPVKPTGATKHEPTTMSNIKVAKSEVKRMKIDIGGGQAIELVQVPGGSCNFGAVKPFWIAATEISNAQYRQFDPNHDSKFIDMPGKDQKQRGYPANNPDQPVIRVSQNDAVRFCTWLTTKLSGKTARLPSELQWEWACRAGKSTPFWFGDLGANFSKFANLADAPVKGKKKPRLNPYPLVQGFSDGNTHAAPVDAYAPNPWGLRNMHGNVAEWTRSKYSADDDRVVVRGGSWRDRPHRATASFRIPYKPYQPVMNVGFRVIVE